MAIILLVCIVVTAASAIPLVNDGGYRDWQQELFDRMELNKLQEGYLSKRSNYGGLYVSPCAAASGPIATYASAASPIAAYAPAAPPSNSYHAGYSVPAYQGHVPSNYGHSYYRSEPEQDNEQELGLSDHAAFDHVPTARYGGSSYGAAPSGTSGPVVGVFSNANVGGCSVPLLVSCSPSIAHGRIVKSQPYYNSAAYPAQHGDSYRGVEEQLHQDQVEGHLENASQLSSDHSPHTSIGDKHQ